MTVIASIDGLSRRVFLHADTVGVETHPIDIYKEMRTLRRTTESLRNFDVYMKASGKDPKGGGKFTERYVTLLLGTRIVPFDTTSEITITGTLITDDGQEGISCFDRSSLSLATVVDINYVPPQVEVIEITTGGMTTEQSTQLEQVHGQVFREIYVDTTELINGNGYQQTPFNNLTDAVDSTESLGLKALVVLADITLNRDLKNFIVTGIGLPTIDFNGFNLKGCSFFHVRMEGLYTNSIIGNECVLLNNSYLNGYFTKCSLAGDTFCIPNSNVLLENCMSEIAGFDRPSISLSVTGWTKLSLRGQRGGLDVRDCNNALDEATIEMMPGSVTLENTCTDGDIILRGVGTSIDDSAGSTVLDEMMHSITLAEILLIAQAVWEYTVSAANVVGSMGEHVTKQLLTFKQFIGLK